MNIVMMTNSYIPMVGGLERSVYVFTEQFRQAGHRVLVVTPETGDRVDDPDVVYTPSIKNIEGSRFSMPLPAPGFLNDRLDEFKPDIFHAHHPFLLGDTALRAALKYHVPLVYTNHTLYERYEHYMPFNSTTLVKLVMALAVGYANLSDRIIAPSESIADLLRERGVTRPLTIIPTGIDIDEYATGDGRQFRKNNRIPDDALVLGIVSRLDQEKNITFLAEAASGYLRENEDAWFLAVGDGDSVRDMHELFRERDVADRLVMTGNLGGRDLVNAYHALDVFVFASKTETQGIVLAEALAAGIPIIGLDAPGIRDIVSDGQNGQLVAEESTDTFVDAFRWFAAMDTGTRDTLEKNARKSAEPYAIDHCAARALELYAEAVDEGRFTEHTPITAFDEIRATISTEWELVKKTLEAIPGMENDK